MTPSTVPSTFPWHRLCNAGHRTFSFLSFSALQRFPEACFLCFLSEEQNHQWETCKTEDSKHCVQCSRLWSSRSQRYYGRDRWWAACQHPRKWSCRTLWAHITCEEDGRGQVAKLLVLVRSALDPRFWAGKVRQDRVDGCVGEVGLEVTVQKQQTETGETWEKSRETTCACNKHLFHDLEPCVCDTHEDVRSTQWARCAQKMCEQHVSVCTPAVAHKVAASTWVWNFTTRKKTSLHDHLGRTPSDFLLGPFDLSHQDLIH